MTEGEFRAAFFEHKESVYRFAWRMTNSSGAAEDIAQDVFFALLRRPDAFDQARGRLRSFLLGIARNLALKRWRDERPWETLEEEHCVIPPLDPERWEIAEAVASAVQSLPPLQREVLVLAEYERLSLEE